MKRTGIIALLLISILLVVWCMVPAKLGRVTTSTPMSHWNVVLTPAGDTNVLASHLSGVRMYVAELGTGLKIQSVERKFSKPLSRIVPLPGQRYFSYWVKVSFLDGANDTYEVVFSGEIGVEPHGLLSPRSFEEFWKEDLSGQVYTVFKESVRREDLFQ